MFISEIKTALKELKKVYSFEYCSFRYHNKHKNGSGNFGTNLRKGDFGVLGYENFEISGDYNSLGEIYSLSFGLAYQHGYKIAVKTLQELYLRIDEIMRELKKEGLK